MLHVRRTGITALSLLVATVTASLVLARGYHLGVAATVVVLLGGLPGLYLMWAAYRDDRTEGAAEAEARRTDLTRVADELAVAVRAQWEAEAAFRHLNDPLLPVRWVPADAGLAEDWMSIVALAASGAGWHVPPPTAGWATDVTQLAGEGADIAGVLERIPTCRLVVLGEPGAGKTMLLVRLVLGLLARRAPGAPVPMLVSLASWNPVSQDLLEWLARQITADHPALEAPADEGPDAKSRARLLITRKLILPVLDGLDELPAALRAVAIVRINEVLLPGQGVVVSSRSDAYKAAIRQVKGSGRKLRGGAVIEVLPTDPATASKYLLRDAEDVHRWTPVLEALGTSSPVGQALVTPLMLSLAREIYAPPPGPSPEGLREPSELFQSAITSRDAVKEHLLDAFIPAVYRRPSKGAFPQRFSWSAAGAERWLMFLGYHLEHVVASPNLVWWQLQFARRHVVTTRLGASIVGTIAFGLTLTVTAGITIDATAKLVTAAAVALASGLGTWAVGTPQRPITGVGWSLRFAVSPSVWLGAWRVGGGPVGRGIMLGRVTFPVVLVLNGLLFGLAAEPAWLLVGIIVLGLHGVYEDPSEIASPQAVLAREQRSLILIGIAAMMYAAVGGFIVGTASGRATRVIFDISGAPALGGAAGLAFGIAAILGLWVTVTSYSRCRLVCGWLALQGSLPWHMITFLEDARRRGVLRQEGGVYQFRHIELQRRLAERFAPR